MDDTDTETVELSRGEARIVISALSEYQVGESGRDEERALNLEELLQREFGFEERHLGDRRGYLDVFTDVFREDSEHEVQLSRVEAEEIVRALDDLETTEGDDADTETIADLRHRFAETFDLDADTSA